MHTFLDAIDPWYFSAGDWFVVALVFAVPLAFSALLIWDQRPSPARADGDDPCGGLCDSVELAGEPLHHFDDESVLHLIDGFDPRHMDQMRARQRLHAIATARSGSDVHVKVLVFPN